MLRRLDRLASQVDALQEDFEALTDEELQAKTQEFKDRLEEGETLDDILVEAFATVREASWRILRMRPLPCPGHGRHRPCTRARSRNEDW